jgi:RHS repeat-associated protein
LGSSNYITNLAGEVSQHLEYLPFGETLVDEHLNSHNTPFKFNGKELDDETGNYYYGARYYNPKWSIWLSVDPLAEETPDWTPYRYAFNNPLRFTDPDGMFENDDWYLNKDNTNYEWFEGSDERSGYINIGEETNVVTNDGKEYVLNSYGSFKDKTNNRSYEKGQTLSVGSNGTKIVSNLNLKEKALNFASNIVAPFVEIPQDLVVGLINQANIIMNEGIHEGRAYDQNNVLIKNTYQFKNWRFVNPRSTQSIGRPTWYEGQRKILNVISVGLTPVTVCKPVINTSFSTINKYVPTLIDEVSKSIILESTDRVLKSVPR